jgi:Calicivirus coat protein
MQRLHFRESTLVSASLLVAATLTLGACSSSGGGGGGNTQPATPATSPAAPTSAPASGEPTSGAGAVSAIEKNWATFFNAKTSTSRRLALLQDGDKLAAVIKAQSTNPLAATASAKVSHVTLTGTDQASVTYSILVSGQAVLSGQQGTAVYQDGVWKVGLASFCALLKLENAGKSSGLPAACKG